MSIADITCKPLPLPCVSEESGITSNGVYYVTVTDGQRNCYTRFTFNWDMLYRIQACACACYNAFVTYDVRPFRDFVIITEEGYPVTISFEPILNTNTYGPAQFGQSQFFQLCRESNIRNFSLNNICTSFNANFRLVNVEDTCNDRITINNAEFIFPISVTYNPPYSYEHFEFIVYYNLYFITIVSNNYIIILFAGVSVLANVCYINYEEIDPFNIKEDYEVLGGLFVGNDLREQDTDLHILKQLIITRSI